jgi:N-acetylneuraminic acid mutarotase
MDRASGIARATSVRRRVRGRAAALLIVGALLVASCKPSGSWETRAPASVARQEVSYIYSPNVGLFFLAGGLRTLQEAYDPRADSWRRVAPLPIAVDHVQAVELNGRIYYIGGLVAWPKPAIGTVYVYDPVTNQFSTGASMPAGRERGAGGVAVHNGKIYYAGGLHDGTAVAWLDVYDPATNSWKKLPDMPAARDHFHGAFVGDRFYVIGGRATAINATTSANIAFDTSTGAWITGLAPLPTSRGGAATAVVGNEVLVIGGEGAGKAYSTVEAYDTASNRWRTLPPIPTARHGTEAAMCGGDIYIADGGTQQGGSAPTAVHEVLTFGDAIACS